MQRHLLQLYYRLKLSLTVLRHIRERISREECSRAAGSRGECVNQVSGYSQVTEKPHQSDEGTGSKLKIGSPTRSATAILNNDPLGRSGGRRGPSVRPRLPKIAHRPRSPRVSFQQEALQCRWGLIVGSWRGAPPRDVHGGEPPRARTREGRLCPIRSVSSDEVYF